MTPAAKYLIDLVRQLDAAQQERAALVEKLDLHIASLESEIETIASGGPRDPDEPGDANDEEPKSDLAFRLIEQGKLGTIEDATVRFYGELNPITRKRMKSVLNYLIKMKRIRPAGDSWEATTPH